MRIVLVGIDEVTAAGLAGLALDKDGPASIVVAEVSSAEEAVASGDTGVMVLGPMVAVEDAFSIAETLAPADSGREIVVIATDPSAETLRTAMHLGIRDMLSAGAPFSEIASAVAVAVESAGHRATPARPAEEPAPARERATTIVTVFSMKGGVGKSVVATNLAVGLAKTGARVVLLDLDLQAGDDAIMLQVIPERTVFEAVQSLDRLDPEMLEGFLAEHSSGVRLLPAPVRPEDAECVTADAVGSLLELLKQMSDFIVIDTPTTLDEVVLTALAHSDQVYSITTMDVPSVKAGRILRQKLHQLGMDSDRTRLVLNRADSRVGLTVSDVEKAIGCPVAARIPSDRHVPLSVNKGKPVLLDAPRSAAARSLSAFAEAVAR